MSQSFVYQALPSRVVFGAGALSQLEAELDKLGVQRALILSTPEQRQGAEAIAQRLGSRAAGVFDRAVMHVPIETAHQAREVARERGADCAIALGGGSTIGLGKAIALDSGLPILAVPTTYAGSEMTPIYGITQEGEKRTGADERVLPRSVIYDPELTLTLPVDMSITSGINAIAHAAEGLYAANGNPITRLMAQEGIRALSVGLPGIRVNPLDIEARGSALYGAWLCGTVLAHGGMALHHKLCHTLGGSFNLPHAQTHTVVLPYVLDFNASFAQDAMSRIAQALGTTGSAAAGIWNLAYDNGAPTSLRALGMTEADLDRAADIATERPYWNPRPLDRIAVRTVLQAAFEGARPA